MKTQNPSDCQKKSPRNASSGWLFLLLLTSILYGCNFPQPTSKDIPPSELRKTEIAGIMYPSEHATQPVSQDTTAQLPIPEQAPLEILDGELAYTTQQGDTLPALALKFDVPVESIRAEIALPGEALLPIGLRLLLPDHLEKILPYHTPIFPDSEVIYGPSVGEFDTLAFIASAGGFLASYEESVKGKILSGPDIVQLVALESSTNPRLLLAFLEYQSGWVLGNPPNAAQDRFPIGYGASDAGLYNELMISARLLAQGFYGWRDGSLLELTFYGGSRANLSPGLNAGSTAIMRLFASLYPQPVWEDRLFGPNSFLLFYQDMFGDPWSRAASVEPYLPHTIEQPILTLPFLVGEYWSLTGGPHITWQTGTPRGALDFAPITGETHCAVSTRWATAAAPGLVVRSNRSVVAIDLNGDGDEGTGWVLIYQHMAEKDRVALNTWLSQDDNVGHPSCEGGQASGTHVHFARKYNGEWVGVSEPLPLVLNGWQAFAGEGRYDGYLQKGDQIVNFRPDGSSGSTIIREE